MKFLHHILLLLMCTFVFCQHKEPSGLDYAYQELVDLVNGTCSKPVPCIEKQDTPYSDHIGLNTECDCGLSCAVLGSCCVDSTSQRMPSPKVRATCRPIMDNATNAFFMMDHCPQQGDGSRSIYEDLCREEWDGQDDVMRLVPVTSLFTGVTYKNYFCFRCHESRDYYVFWGVNIYYNEATVVKKECGKVQLQYIKKSETWYAPVGPGCSSVPVAIDFAPAAFTEHLTKRCDLNLISKCSEKWLDVLARYKCDGYLHQTIIWRDGKYLQYRNPHCALCNYESLDNVVCWLAIGHHFSWGGKKTFPFTMLLDVNSADGDRVGKIQRCRGNDVWDPFFNKCRSLECLLPRYTVQDGKCIPP